MSPAQAWRARYDMTPGRASAVSLRWTIGLMLVQLVLQGVQLPWADRIALRVGICVGAAALMAIASVELARRRGRRTA